MSFSGDTEDLNPNHSTSELCYLPTSFMVCPDEMPSGGTLEVFAGERKTLTLGDSFSYKGKDEKELDEREHN